VISPLNEVTKQLYDWTKWVKVLCEGFNVSSSDWERNGGFGGKTEKGWTDWKGFTQNAEGFFQMFKMRKV